MFLIEFFKTLQNKIGVPENLDLLTVEEIRQIELCTRGQCYNEKWSLCRKRVITASKVQEAIVNMEKS